MLINFLSSQRFAFISIFIVVRFKFYCYCSRALESASAVFRLNRLSIGKRQIKYQHVRYGGIHSYDAIEFPHQCHRPGRERNEKRKATKKKQQSRPTFNEFHLLGIELAARSCICRCCWEIGLAFSPEVENFLKRHITFISYFDVFHSLAGECV